MYRNRGSVLDLMKSCLFNRKQYVRLIKDVLIDVPWETISVPSLFIIYIHYISFPAHIHLPKTLKCRKNLYKEHKLNYSDWLHL